MVDKFWSIYKKYKEVLNYLIVGVLTTIVSLGTYYGCVITFLNPKNPIELQYANIISWMSAVTFAYITNRKFVFNSQNKSVIKEITSFYLSRVSTLFLDMVTMFVLVSIFFVNDKVAKILVQVIIMIVNYLLSKFFVFKS